MSGSKPAPLIWLALLLFCFPDSFCSTHKNSIIPCPEIEKQALLSFKQSITSDPWNVLSSWNTSNCCNWEGVSCSNSTGHVDGLDLPGARYLGGLLISDSLEGRISPSLLNLTQLKYLDLSFNNFEEIIPSFMGSLTSLEYLNLSGAGFHGMIPHTIGNLSNIKTLSLGVNYGRFSDGMFVDSLEWLSGLSQLQHLNLNNVNLSRAANWVVQVISTLPSLVELRLQSCSLDYMAPVNDVNTTSLTILDLSNNFLKSSIPDWLYSCKDLKFVSMTYCSLENTISDAIENLTSLAVLDLSLNELTGKIPRGIVNFGMKSLDLQYNKLEGEISYLFGNMSDCFLGSLTSLDLSGNQLSGHLPHQFADFKSLKYLELGQNKISGEIPTNLGNLAYLEDLKLNENKLTGNLPVSMGQLSNLETLDLGNNMFEGVVTEIHFANLTKLIRFAASGNHLTLKVNPNWIPPFNLRFLHLGSWNLGAGLSIPSWLDTQKNTMEELDLSSTGISGNVPAWFWRLRLLNISHNHLYGKVPDISGPEENPQLMYLNSNQFSGKIPRVGNTLEEINLSNNSFSGGISHFICDMRNESPFPLVNIHLGGNHLTGEIPDCWMKWPSLRVLNLGNNNFSGTIPNSIGFLTDMLSLNLYGNKLSGQIPIAISNCSELIKMDLSSNYFVGNIPKWIGASLTKLRFLVLRSNQFSDVIPSSICQLKSLQIFDISDNVISGKIPSCVNNFTAMTTKRNLSDYWYGDLDYSYYISGSFLESASVATKGNEYEYSTILSLVTNIDLSNNNLSGEIPKELMSLVELRSLNLSRNHLIGSIPKSIGNMKQLESLDLSRNSLLGEIPDSFTAMSSLSYLNLSCNHLTGKIPESTQLMGMNASGFIGNNLCGLPLPTNCSQGDDAHGPLHKEDTKGEVDWFYVFLSLGYAVGFSIFFTTLILKKSWQTSYFGWIECMWDKLYVYFHNRWAKLRGHE